MARAGLYFTTRSASRDTASDALRRRSVQQSIEAVLEETQRELSGLERRIANARLAAISLMDTTGSYEERAAADEQAIVDFEREVDRASQRTSALRVQIATYEKMLAIVMSV